MTTWGGTQYEWSDPIIIGLGITVVIGAIITVIVESKAKEPLIPVHLFKNRNMVLTTASGTVLGLAMFGVLGYMPTYLQMVHTLTPTKAGLMMIPMMVGLIGTSTIVGFIIARTGHYKMYPIIGLIITTGALFWMSKLTVATPLPSWALSSLSSAWALASCNRFWSSLSRTPSPSLWLVLRLRPTTSSAKSALRLVLPWLARSSSTT